MLLLFQTKEEESRVVAGPCRSQRKRRRVGVEGGNRRSHHTPHLLSFVVDVEEDPDFASLLLCQRRHHFRFQLVWGRVHGGSISTLETIGKKIIFLEAKAGLVKEVVVGNKMDKGNK